MKTDEESKYKTPLITGPHFILFMLAVVAQYGEWTTGTFDLADGESKMQSCRRAVPDSEER